MIPMRGSITKRVLDSYKNKSSNSKSTRSNAAGKVPVQPSVGVSTVQQQSDWLLTAVQDDPWSLRSFDLWSSSAQSVQCTTMALIQAAKTVAMSTMLTLGPHVVLIGFMVAYVLFGGWAFVQLERDNQEMVLQRKDAAIDDTTNKLLEKMWNISQNSSADFRDFDKQTMAEFLDFAEAVYEAQLGGKAKGRQLANTTMNVWYLENSWFFCTNFLSSIGFGYIAPVTDNGRIFCVIYGMLGIPLTLVTVGNLAKFSSDAVYWMFERYLRIWAKLKGTYSAAETEQMLEDVEEHLLKIKLFRFPTPLLFVVVFVYGLVVACIFMHWENWGLVEALYFTMISIFTVGFGDIRPSVQNQWWALLLLLIGVMITTMCMDILGSMYLEEIHNLGRHVAENNPWAILKAKQAARRRQQTANLLANLAQLMALRPAQRAPDEGKKKSKRSRIKARKLNSIADKDNRIGQLMFTQSAPDPPSDCQISSTSAHTIRLAWNPPFAQKGVIHYNVTCMPKYTEGTSVAEQQILRVFGITGCSFEVTNLESCSLYELTVMAYSNYGYSKACRLMEYTEPELSPQHVAADKMSPIMIRIHWEQPLKRIKDIVGYMIYHIDGKQQALDNWKKVEIRTAEARSYVFTNLFYDTFYRYCVRGIYKDTSYTPLSRAIVIKTDKLNFNARVIGHSRSVEVMDGLARREQTNVSTLDTDETTPLLTSNSRTHNRSKTPSGAPRYSLY